MLTTPGMDPWLRQIRSGQALRHKRVRFHTSLRLRGVAGTEDDQSASSVLERTTEVVL
jgi:hypothetical protein